MPVNAKSELAHSDTVRDVLVRRQGAVLQSHVVFGGQAGTRAKYVFDAGALLEQRVHDGHSARDDGRLEQVRQ